MVWGCVLDPPGRRLERASDVPYSECKISLQLERIVPPETRIFPRHCFDSAAQNARLKREV
jgi:hypothetical protein